jgi:hypothetical protein
MKRVILFLIMFLSSCAVSPETAKKKQIESAFLNYQNKAISWSPQVEVLEHDLGEIHDNPSNPPIGFKKTGYFVSYDPDPYCVGWFSVYEKCADGVCEYKFEDTGGICE